MNTAHQAAALTIEIRVYLLLKCGLIEVARSNGNTKSDCLLLSFARHILKHSHRRIDATTLTEEGTHSAARAFGSHKNDIDVFGNVDLGKVLEDRREAMGEVERLLKSAASHGDMCNLLTFPLVN